MSNNLRLTLNGQVLDRRSFLGALSLAAVAAGPVFGGRLLKAAPGANGTASLSLEGSGALGTWHVDDMWGHMPRYAHPISCRALHVPLDLNHVDQVDHAFVA